MFWLCTTIFVGLIPWIAKVVAANALFQWPIDSGFLWSGSDFLVVGLVAMINTAFEVAAYDATTDKQDLKMVMLFASVFGIIVLVIMFVGAAIRAIVTPTSYNNSPLVSALIVASVAVAGGFILTDQVKTWKGL